MTNYNDPLRGQCESCDESRLDIRCYEVISERGEELEVFWCKSCADLARNSTQGNFTFETTFLTVKEIQS